MALTVEAIDTAIEKILTTGQSVSVDGMTYTAANLSQLRELRMQLKAEGRVSTRPTGRAFNIRSMGY